MIKIKTLFLEEILDENFRVRKKMNLINNLDSTKRKFNCLVLIVQTYLIRGGQIAHSQM